ncbi:hypothetical protein KCP70_06895 [Salmonella enterica subsp. enterica]|nr:hypothetical protein KCP70_06895 [Salmonella enterica subsp. enterica]
MSAVVSVRRTRGSNRISVNWIARGHRDFVRRQPAFRRSKQSDAFNRQRQSALMLAWARG